MRRKKEKTPKTKKAPAAMSSIQRHYYQITINSPVEHGFPHEAIKKTLVENFPTLKFFCMGDEMGTNYHTHIYVVFTSRVRLSTVKKAFPCAHIEEAKGTPQQNVDYILKGAKWVGTEKAETQIPGTYEEWGDFPTQAGHDPQWENLYRMIDEGMSPAEIIQYNNDYLPDVDLIAKVRQMLIIEKNKAVRLDMHVVYIFGATGTGKTRGLVEAHGSELYRVTDYAHPFDGYNYNSVIAFDEYHGQLPLPAMLDYLDIYPAELPSRYSNKFICYNLAYIVSNLPLEAIYEGYRTSGNSGDMNAYKAWLRRIHEVWYYAEDGTITKYDSVEKYLKRNEKFHPVDSGTKPPFEEENDSEIHTNE